MTSVFIVLLIATVCSSVAAHVVGRLRDRQTHTPELPPLLLPLADGIALDEQPAVVPPPRPAAPVAPSSPAPIVPVPALVAAASKRAVESDFAPPAPTPVPAPAETVRLARPTEDAVQLLPARLEVIAGMPRRQDIRFIRTPGEIPQMILGREPGASPHHVTLTSSTVSRRHAQVAFTNGQWKVVNLSSTNPVVVNDHALPGPHSEQTLVDGDRIELGDVVLRFRAG